jgi:hypothetical protein
MPQGGDPVSDILGSILGGGQQQQQSRQAPPQADNPIGDILGGILGGGQQQAPQRPQAPQMPQGGDPVSDILGSILGGGQQQPQSRQAPPQADNPIGDILGGILGGGQQQAPQPPASDPTGGILGGILGGGGSGNILLDALGAAIGSGVAGGGVLGAGASAAGNKVLSPIADMISQKLGIPKTIAMMIVSFAATKLLKGALGGNAQGKRFADVVDPELFSAITGGQANQRYIRNSGMVDEAMRQTGLDRATATKSLQMVFDQFGQQLR